MLETACHRLAAWAADPELAILTVVVNISTRQFRQPEFIEHVRATLERTGANPYELDLELSESLFAENVDEIIQKMFTLRALGISLTLDDFGTGYSSLFHVRRMPLDRLKIDCTFVRDLMTDPNDAAIAKAILTLGHALGSGSSPKVSRPAISAIFSLFWAAKIIRDISSAGSPANRRGGMSRGSCRPRARALAAHREPARTSRV